MIITDPGLELRSDWTLETGPNINPIPADSFVGTHMGDSSYRITNVSSKAYGGALLTNKRQVPMLQGSTMNQVFYAGLDLEFLISSADLPFLWAHETDVKACVQGAPNSSTKIPNVFNWSAQVNMGKGGMFQIDAIPGKPGWVDTGIKVPPVPDVWNRLRIRYKADVAAALFSVLSVNGMGIDPGQQNMPLQVTNWQPVAAVQLQNEVAMPGVVNISYRNIALLYSPDPF
jgi:hypothetical protein